MTILKKILAAVSPLALHVVVGALTVGLGNIEAALDSAQDWKAVEQAFLGGGAAAWAYLLTRGDQIAAALKAILDPPSPKQLP